MGFETERLILRYAEAGDAEPIASLLNNFAMSGNLSVVPYPYTLNDAHDWIATLNKDNATSNTHFVIQLKNQGVVGAVGFQPDNDCTEIGYWLGEPYWGQGLMTEALRAGLSWFFAQSDDDYVRAGVFSFNLASLALQKKLGFVETGRSNIWSVARNAQMDLIDTQLTRHAFRALAL